MVSRRELAARIVLVTGALLVGLLVLELGCRLTKGRWWLAHWPNPTIGTFQELATYQGQWADHDPLLGWVPRPGVSTFGAFDRGGFRHTPLSDGRGPLVATGGSFTQGDDVTEAEAWPAILERITGHDVVNAGVSGYGIDQIVLRSEQLARTLRPAVLIVAFTADNVWRNEMSRLWGGEKPYFALRGGGELELHNVPVPPPPYSATLLQQLFGWSILLETVLQRLDGDSVSMSPGDAWLTGSIRALPAGDGESVACALMGRLRRLDTPVLVVAQYERSTWEDDAALAAEQRRLAHLVLHCASDAGVATLDTFDVLDLAARQGGPSVLYGAGHHNRAGNAIVARLINEALNRHGLLPPAKQATSSRP